MRQPCGTNLIVVWFDRQATGRSFFLFCFTAVSNRSQGHLPQQDAAFQWRRPGSNRQPQACKASALPVELRPQEKIRSPNVEIRF